ncbi:MAG: hypothetical protein NTZ44_01100 [Candidatus Nomurabacteria bacterium]|nr:hypothetical protein [Candidatus Nomurabacteria bacterium]
MTILNGPTDFENISKKDLLKRIQNRKDPINFEKVDFKRDKKTNRQILQLFHQFINSPGLHEILLWYKSQSALLAIYKDINKGVLKFYGCNRHIEHHDSNIEYIIKWFLHRILYDNGKNKELVDRYTLALCAIGPIPLISREERGNIYQGHEINYYCNVATFKVSISNEQIFLARNILRLINNKELLN